MPPSRLTIRAGRAVKADSALGPCSLSEEEAAAWGWDGIIPSLGGRERGQGVKQLQLHLSWGPCSSPV